MPNHENFLTGESKRIIVTSMADIPVKNGAVDGKQKGVETLAGYLMSALDMEEKISHSVYRDYLNRAIWPDHLDDKTFSNIKECLTTLLEDTERHRKTILALSKEITGR